jgi:hypothetical protein
VGIQQMLLGGSQFGLNAEAASSTDVETPPNPAVSGITFASDGTVNEVNAAGFTLVLYGDPALLEVRVTGTGDSPNGGTGTLNTWEALGVSFTLTADPGSLDFDGNYEIRVAATGQVLDGNTFNLHSESTP